MELILASNSPRRREILSEMGYEFTVIPSTFNEEKVVVSGRDTAQNLAYLKAKEVFSTLSDSKNKVVLGADTIVFFENKIFGKPENEKQAKEMLTKLSANTHEVITGYALITNEKVYKGSVTSYVTFNKLSDDFIEEYILKAKPLDKAGSYGIQDGYELVAKFDGSYDNIVGLPSEKIGEILKEIFTK